MGPRGGLSGVSWGLLLPLSGPSWACPGALLGRLRRLLGSLEALWGRLGLSWGPLRPSWGGLGGLFGCLGALEARKREEAKNMRKTNENQRLCPLRALLGPLSEFSWGSWRPLGKHFGDPRSLVSGRQAVFGCLGASWAVLSRFGGSLGASSTVLGRFGASLGGSGARYWRCTVDLPEMWDAPEKY